MLVLVICDYATRFPEAIPLKNIDAAHIAEEIIKVFAQVGVPEDLTKGAISPHICWLTFTDCSLSI